MCDTVTTATIEHADKKTKTLVRKERHGYNNKMTRVDKKIENNAKYETIKSHAWTYEPKRVKAKNSRRASRDCKRGLKTRPKTTSYMRNLPSRARSIPYQTLGVVSTVRPGSLRLVASWRKISNFFSSYELKPKNTCLLPLTIFSSRLDRAGSIRYFWFE